MVFAGKFHRADLQNLAAQARQLQHFFKRDGIHAARFGHHARVGGVNAVHIGVDLAFVGFERGGKRHRRCVRAAAPQRGNIARAADALKARHNHHRALRQIGAHFVAVNRFNAGFGVRCVGFHGNLPARVAFGFHTDVFQRHRQ